MPKKITLFLFGFIFLFSEFGIVKATEAPVILYTFNGTSANIVVNPIVNPVEIRFDSSENIPNWVSIKIEKADDSSIYKTFSPNSCDGAKYCNQVWDGAISPKNKILADGIYNVLVHIRKDVADPVTYDLTLTSPYTITVDSSVSSRSDFSTSSSGGSSLPQTTTETKTKVTEIQKIKTKIEGETLAFVGIPVEFNAMTTGHMNETLSYGKYFWNFGDGDSKEMDTSNKAKFTHTFFYESEYIVMLEYYQNYSSEEPDAIDKMTIKVIPANVSISNVGDEKDFFIEITNNTLYDADISKWILLSNQKSFTLPRNMILESKKKIILSPKITGFSFSDKDSLKLLNPQRETMFDYSGVLKPIETQTKNLVSKISKLNTNESREAVKPPFGGFTAKLADAEMPTDNLLANASESDIPLAESSNFNYSIFGLFAFLGISGSTAYFIRNRNRKIIGEANGSDFEILDE